MELSTDIERVGVAPRPGPPARVKALSSPRKKFCFTTVYGVADIAAYLHLDGAAGVGVANFERAYARADRLTV